MHAKGRVFVMIGEEEEMNFWQKTLDFLRRTV